MAQYRSKRIKVIEAEQFWPDKPWPKSVQISDQGPCVTTIHGQRAFLNPGDWIITEPGGYYHYPCKPEIFADTYEPVSP